MKKEVKKSMVMNNQLNVFLDDKAWPNHFLKLADDVFVVSLDYLQKHELGQKIGFAKPVVINLSLNDDQFVHKLNLQFRGIDKSTNVLSFANIDDESFFAELKYAEYVELGDIIIAFETLQNEANSKKISLENHFSHLLIHGILHLFGYDHQNDIDADEMESIEIQILKMLNINNPYEEQ